MTSLSEQLSAAPNNYLTAPMNAQLTVLNALATQAIDSASRITALNLTTSQEVLERSAQTARQLIGATNPVEAAPGSIRGDFALEVTFNMVHGSDSDESAEREIGIWFPEL